MMKNVEVDELVKVLETIRKEKYPDLPEELISNIVNVQFKNQDDRVKARNDTKKLIDTFLKINASGV